MLVEAGTAVNIGQGLATHPELLEVYISLSSESYPMMEVLNYSFYR